MELPGAWARAGEPDAFGVVLQSQHNLHLVVFSPCFFGSLAMCGVRYYFFGSFLGSFLLFVTVFYGAFVREQDFLERGSGGPFGCLVVVSRGFFGVLGVGIDTVVRVHSGMGGRAMGPVIVPVVAWPHDSPLSASVGGVGIVETTGVGWVGSSVGASGGLNIIYFLGTHGASCVERGPVPGVVRCGGRVT